MEWYTTADGKYRIESLTASTFPGALEVMKEAYVHEESVCIGAEVNKNPKAIEELLYMCAYVALDGVSLVAVTTDTGEVASVAFNLLSLPPSDSSHMADLAEKIKHAQDSTQSMFQFTEVIDERCNLFERLGVDCSLEILFLSTLHKHRKQRLGELLCKFSIELGRKLKDGPVSVINVEDLGPEFKDLKKTVTKKHPKICEAMWTAEATQKIGKRLNFTVHLTVSLSEFVFKGKTYSERIGKEGTCELGAIIL